MVTTLNCKRCETEICRENGWRVGTVLVSPPKGSEDYDVPPPCSPPDPNWNRSLRIRITAIGKWCILAENVETGEESMWFLNDRQWREETRVGWREAIGCAPRKPGALGISSAEAVRRVRGHPPEEGESVMAERDSIMLSITREDLHRAARQLGQSDRGREAMRGLLDWLNERWMSLDERNQQAVLILLLGAFGSYTGSAREAMAAALEVE